MWVLVERYKSPSNYIALEQKTRELTERGPCGLESRDFARQGAKRLLLLIATCWLFNIIWSCDPLILIRSQRLSSFQDLAGGSDYGFGTNVVVYKTYEYVLFSFFFLPNHWPQCILVAVRSKVPFDPLKIWTMRTRNGYEVSSLPVEITWNFFLDLWRDKAELHVHVIGNRAL